MINQDKKYETEDIQNHKKTSQNIKKLSSALYGNPINTKL